MSAVSTWSTVASSNDSVSPDGFPESMLAAGVNNSNREMMAAIKVFYDTLIDSNADISFTVADAGAKPVLTLTQSDVDEDYFKFIGTSDTSADRALVDAANFTTPGAIVGWLKCNVQDDQGSSPITDGDYYIPFYAVPTA